MTETLRRYIAILLFALLLFACGKSRHEALFSDLNSRIEANPDSAYTYIKNLAENDSLIGKMSAHDCARLNLLRIKAADKAYVPHTSDSLIRTGVLDYYERHTGAKEYPEALYYAGRVYSDLGDSPTALRYFQEGIEAIKPATKEEKALLGTLLSQTGRLLDELRDRNTAIQYLERAIDIDRQLRDSINLMYDYDLIGLVYCQQQEFKKCLYYYKLAYSIAEWKDPDFAVKIRSNIAKCYLDMNYVKRAETIINEIPDSLESKLNSSLLATASEVYYNAGNFDLAEYYANKLAAGYRGNNARTGYHILFKPEIIKNIPKDSLEILIDEYVTKSKEYLKRNGDERANIQNSIYNYNLHDQARKEAENTQRIMGWWIVGIVFVSLVAVITILFNRNQKQKEIIHLQQVISELESNSKSATKDQSENIEVCHEHKVEDITPSSLENKEPQSTKGSVTPDFLRSQLRSKILEEYKEEMTCPPRDLDPLIKNSDIYSRLLENLRIEHSISDERQTWEDLRKVIDQVSPRFFTSLEGISKGKLTQVMAETAMLTKCRFTPGEIAKLTGRKPSSISDRKEKLRSKLFENIITSEELTHLLWSL